MNLQYEIVEWTNKDTGEVKEYPRYYVNIQGIKVNLKPADHTGNQLIQLALGINKDEVKKG